MFFPYLQRLHTVGRFQNLIAIHPEYQRSEFPQIRFILDKKNGFFPTVACLLFHHRFGGGFWLNHWQMDLESRALAHIAGDGHSTFVLFENPKDRGKSKSCALARWFGGEKRLENARQDVWWNPVTVVRYDEAQMPAGFDAGHHRHLFRSDVCFTGPDPDASSARHCIAGIDD